MLELVSYASTGFACTVIRCDIIGGCQRARMPLAPYPLQCEGGELFERIAAKGVLTEREGGPWLAVQRVPGQPNCLAGCAPPLHICTCGTTAALCSRSVPLPRSAARFMRVEVVRGAHAHALPPCGSVHCWSFPFLLLFHPLRLSLPPLAPPSAAAHFMRMMVEVVRHAHALGICHRDIKPENFMLSDRSDKARIKACDFGGWRGGRGQGVGEDGHVSVGVVLSQCCYKARIKACNVGGGGLGFWMMVRRGLAGSLLRIGWLGCGGKLYAHTALGPTPHLPACILPQGCRSSTAPAATSTP